MTYLDDIPDTAPTGRASTSSAPTRPGLWRVISMLAVVAALVITAISVLQARAASDVPVPDQAPVALETTTVTVGDLPLLGSMEIVTLGLPAADSRRAFDPAGTDLEVPEGRAAVVALISEDGSLMGLRLVTAEEDRAAIEITARSTARALIALSPGVLSADLESTLFFVDGYTNDPAFDELVDAVRINPNLSIDNDIVETAYAEIADRIEAPNPTPDQGCDSVSATSAYVSAGACVQPRGEGVVVSNEQDRWALIFAEGDDYAQLCAIVSPENTANDEILVEGDDCPGEALMVAPGPMAASGTQQSVIEQRVGAAAAINVLYDYAGPFADLAGSSAGFNDETVPFIADNAALLTDAMMVLLDRSEEFARAMEVSLVEATPQDRQVAAASATRLIIDSGDSAGIIPQRVPGDIGHLPILDFYTRASERMLSSRIDVRWEAAAVGRIEVGTSE